MELFSFTLRVLFGERERFLVLRRALSSLNNLLQVLYYKGKILASNPFTGAFHIKSIPVRVVPRNKLQIILIMFLCPMFLLTRAQLNLFSEWISSLHGIEFEEVSIDSLSVLCIHIHLLQI